MTGSRVCVLALCLLIAPTVVAHDGLHQRLQVVTSAIDADPVNGPLHLARARLHREHEDPDAAFADLDRAKALGVDPNATAMLRAALLMDTKRPNAALAILGEVVSRHPAHAAAHTRRGQALEAMGRPRAAAAAYRNALDHTGERRPRHYLARSSALAQAGDVDAAVAALDAGIADLGPLIVLMERAIDLEREAKRSEAGLARLDRIIARVHRPEKWLALRGDVLAESGRPEAARASRLAALAAIARLPRSRRTTRAVLDLETALHHRLAEPETPRPETPEP